MATTKTTKLADAISLLSDVLSTEIAEGNHFLEDEDDSVSDYDHEELKDAAEKLNINLEDKDVPNEVSHLIAI